MGYGHQSQGRRTLLGALLLGYTYGKSALLTLGNAAKIAWGARTLFVICVALGGLVAAAAAMIGAPPHVWALVWVVASLIYALLDRKFFTRDPDEPVWGFVISRLVLVAPVVWISSLGTQGLMYQSDIYALIQGWRTERSEEVFQKAVEARAAAIDSEIASIEAANRKDAEQLRATALSAGKAVDTGLIAKSALCTKCEEKPDAEGCANSGCELSGVPGRGEITQGLERVTIAVAGQAQGHQATLVGAALERAEAKIAAKDAQSAPRLKHLREARGQVVETTRSEDVERLYAMYGGQAPVELSFSVWNKAREQVVSKPGSGVWRSYAVSLFLEFFCLIIGLAMRNPYYSALSQAASGCDSAIREVLGDLPRLMARLDRVQDRQKKVALRELARTTRREKGAYEANLRDYMKTTGCTREDAVAALPDWEEPTFIQPHLPEEWVSRIRGLHAAARILLGQQVTALLDVVTQSLRPQTHGEGWLEDALDTIGLRYDIPVGTTGGRLKQAWLESIYKLDQDIKALEDLMDRHRITYDSWDTVQLGYNPRGGVPDVIENYDARANAQLVRVDLAAGAWIDPEPADESQTEDWQAGRGRRGRVNGRQPGLHS